jgi:alkylhydroperoxidase family enzyme
MIKADPAIIDAAKAGTTIADAKLEALAATAKALTINRGHLSNDQKDAFFAAGYTQLNLIELVVGVTMKTLTNYVDHVNPVTIDAAFAGEAN